MTSGGGSIKLVATPAESSVSPVRLPSSAGTDVSWLPSSQSLVSPVRLPSSAGTDVSWLSSSRSSGQPGQVAQFGRNRRQLVAIQPEVGSARSGCPVRPEPTSAGCHLSRECGQPGQVAQFGRNRRQLVAIQPEFGQPGQVAQFGRNRRQLVAISARVWSARSGCPVRPEPTSAGCHPARVSVSPVRLPSSAGTDVSWLPSSPRSGQPGQVAQFWNQ